MTGTNSTANCTITTYNTTTMTSIAKVRAKSITTITKITVTSNASTTMDLYPSLSLPCLELLLPIEDNLLELVVIAKTTPEATTASGGDVIQEA